MSNHIDKKAYYCETNEHIEFLENKFISEEVVWVDKSKVKRGDLNIGDLPILFINRNGILTFVGFTNFKLERYIKSMEKDMKLIMVDDLIKKTNYKSLMLD